MSFNIIITEEEGGWAEDREDWIEALKKLKREQP